MLATLPINSFPTFHFQPPDRPVDSVEYFFPSHYIAASEDQD